MKKQKATRSQPKKRKQRPAPLPLDTSRGRHAATPRPPAAVARPVARPASASPAAPLHAPLSRLWRRIRTSSRSERADAAMLALPVLLLAFTIGVSRWSDAEREAAAVATLTPGAKRALIGLPPKATPVEAVAVRAGATPASPPTQSVVALRPPAGAQVALSESRPQGLTAAAPPLLPASPTRAALEAARTEGPLEGMQAGVPPDLPLATVPGTPGRPVAAVRAAPVMAAPASARPEVFAALPPDRAALSWDFPGGAEALAAGLTQCRFERTPARTPLPVTWSPGDPDSFGLALAAAARRQLEDFVIYNDRYTRMKYPMGDVHPMYGVCTDVVIRAYRDLGLDLQELVQKTKTGSGDPNIDHRRVDTLRKFFSRYGESLPISSFAEDYKPGDVVTYWRPQNRHSRTHIAIVSDMTGPSGRPLIIHNRGWGPQQEDGLFVDEITGHYRFSGLKAGAHEVQTRTPTRQSRAEERPPQTPRPVVRTGLSKPAQPAR